MDECREPAVYIDHARGIARKMELKGSMSKRSSDYHKRGKKAAKTRQKNELHDEMKRRGQRAGITVDESELGYIDELKKTKKLGRNEKAFHHKGLPDLMIITENGKMKFYEIKLKTGSSKRTKLNSNQAEAIKELLKHDYVNEVNLVRYTKLGPNKYRYDSPLKITQINIDRFSDRSIA